MRASARSRRSASTGAIDADAGLARRGGDAGAREVTGSAMTRSMAARVSERKSSAAKELSEDEGVRFRDGVSAVEGRGNLLKRAAAMHAQDEEDEQLVGRFECNVCFETAREPVVTPCGHLYCWRCVKQWLDGGNHACPVCKSTIDQDVLIPLYGLGVGEANRASGKNAKQELSSSRSLAALLGLRPNEDLTLGRAQQLLLSRVLLTIGTLIIICLLII